MRREANEESALPASFAGEGASGRNRVPAPITNPWRFKQGKGRIKKPRESPDKRSFTAMRFNPRDIGPKT